VNNLELKVLLVTVVAAGILAIQLTIKANTPQPQELCLNNIVMVKHDDMWVQKDLWPQHCVAISKD